MRTEILKAKITKEGTMIVSYMEYLDDDSTNLVNKECGALVHEDLRLAFSALQGHMAHLCELKESVKLDLLDPDHAELVKNIYVTGLSFGGSDENAGVVLVGGKKLSNGKVLNLVAPFTKFEDEDYEYITELRDDVRLCRAEIESYVFEGKAAVRQLDLFEDQEPEPEEPEEPGDDYKVTMCATGETPVEVTGKQIRMVAKKLEKQTEAVGF